MKPVTTTEAPEFRRRRTALSALTLIAATLIGPLASAVASPAAQTSTGGVSEIKSLGAVLTVTPARSSKYVARGTMPLRAGRQFEGTCPFGLRRGDVIHPAQWSPVTWNAEGDLGVVELSAVVNLLPGDLAAGEVTFEIVEVPSGFPPGLPEVPAAVFGPMITTGDIWIRVRDALGNTYLGAVGQDLDSEGSQVEVLGPVKTVYHTRGPLERTSGPGGAPERLGGFHAWFTVHSKNLALELDLQWHNATAGSPEEMAPDVLFESVELLLPPDWNAALKWPYPEQGVTYQANDYNQQWTVVELVADGATPHVLRQRGRLTWRTALWKNGGLGQGHATDRLEGLGWGVVRGPINSWQDPLTAGWLAQGTPLPSLDHWGTAFGDELTAMRAEIETALIDGTPYYYDGVGQMGPYHSYGTAYGGMTGGDEIDQTPGAALMWTGNVDGLVALQTLHRMVLDRQYGWFFDSDGSLLTEQDLVDTNGELTVNVFSNDFIATSVHDDLGFGAVPDDYAGVLPRPTYEDSLLGTTPYDGLEQHDAQHAARATWPLKVLVWGANDRMARHDLIAQAALWQMEFHHGPGGRLDGLRQWAQAHPHVTGEFGRGEAWIVDTMAHWYALSKPAERAAFTPWFDEVLVTLRTLRTDLGLFYGNRTGKITDYYEFDNQYAITQWYEHGILMHALRTMHASWATDPAVQAELANYIVTGTLAAWRQGWKAGTSGTWEQQAVAPIDPALPAFGSLAETPSDGFGGGPINDQIAGIIGYSVPLASPLQLLELLLMAQALTQDPYPLTGLENQYPYYLQIENRAPLLAWLQVIDALLP